MKQQNWQVFSRRDLMKNKPARNGSAGNGPPRKIARRRRLLIAGLLLAAVLTMIGGALSAWSAGLLPTPVWPALLEKLQALTKPDLSGKQGETPALPHFFLPLPGTGEWAKSGLESPPGAASENATDVPETPGVSPPETRVPPSPDQAAIEAYYLDRLVKISRSYEGRLNGLVGQAQGEYTDARRNGQKVAVFSLAKRYLSAGSTLEKQCDADFYAVLADFKTELRKNSFPLDKPLEAQKQYERAKAARKRQILTAAAKML